MTNNIFDIVRNEWKGDDGFFFQMRIGGFAKERLTELLSFLRNFSTEGEDCVNKKLIDLLWEIPAYVEAHKEEVHELNPDDFIEIENLTYDLYIEVKRILTE